MLGPGERRTVATGLAVAIPPGHGGFVQPRSGLAARHGITVVNSPGLIDSGYRGELKVVLLNTDAAEPFHVRRRRPHRPAGRAGAARAGGDRGVRPAAVGAGRARLRVIDGEIRRVSAPRIRVGALLRHGDAVLLLRQEKLDRSYWLLPGGGVEEGESLHVALARELTEECGLEGVTLEGPIAIVESIAPPSLRPRKHVVHVIFYADVSRPQPRGRRVGRRHDPRPPADEPGRARPRSTCARRSTASSSAGVRATRSSTSASCGCDESRGTSPPVTSGTLPSDVRPRLSRRPARRRVAIGALATRAWRAAYAGAARARRAAQPRSGRAGVRVAGVSRRAARTRPRVGDLRRRGRAGVRPHRAVPRPGRRGWARARCTASTSSRTGSAPAWAGASSPTPSPTWPPATTPIVVWHFAANDVAARFYERAGFVLDGARRRSEFGVPELRRRRSLTSLRRSRPRRRARRARGCRRAARAPPRRGGGAAPRR